MIRSYLSGDREIMARLDQLNGRLPGEMRIGMERLTVKLQTRVKRKLSGDVLNVRTGRLRNGVSRDVQADGLQVTGIVSDPVKYAPPHEYGFRGTVDVREHMRTIRQAFGRPIEEKQITVRQHSMQMNLPERSFLRSALAEMESAGEIRGEMEAAAARAAAE